MECFDAWLQVPYFFEQVHVLTLQVQLGLSFPEGLGRGFGLPQPETQMFNFTFVGQQPALPLLLDGFDMADVLLVLLLRLLLVELILVDGPGCDY